MHFTEWTVFDINCYTGTIYAPDGFSYKYGKNHGRDREGYNREGFNELGVDREGYRRNGYNDSGLNRNGRTKEQQEEFDVQEQKDKVNQRRANYLGLINKAEKLGKGEISLEDYVKSSKTSIEELIEFAKKEKMSADVIRGLYKYKKPYAIYKKPFSKKQYLEGTILLIDGQEVRPTETDVDKCVEFLKANDSLICDKTVRDTVRKYLRGEIDFTIKEEGLQEQSKENKIIMNENEDEIKHDLVEVLVGQQKKIKTQEAEIADLKSQDKGEV